jgi:hypothetical protein
MMSRVVKLPEIFSNPRGWADLVLARKGRPESRVWYQRKKIEKKKKRRERTDLFVVSKKRLQKRSVPYRFPEAAS